jgi:nitrile hydratase accessory protein
MTKPAYAPFAAPWQAELFCLTLALSNAGHFSWPDWTAAFGATLKRHGAIRPLDGGDDYYAAWLETLETLLEQMKLVKPADARSTRERWEKAYLTTPHGQPVTLRD